MQVEHSSKYNMFMGSGVNKCSLSASVSAGGSSNRNSSLTPLRSADDSTSAPKIQYLTPNCILLTYDDGDIGALLDEHFRKSLTTSGKAPTRPRNLPPSFWNRHYARSQRSSAVFANAAAAAAMAASPGGAASSAGFGYYPDAYSSLLRSHQQTAALCWPSYGASHQALAAAVSGQQASAASADAASTSRDLSTQAAAAAYGLSEASILNGHMNDAVHAYNPFLSLTRPAPNAGFVAPSRLPAPPQYSNIRNDWTAGLPAAVDTVARDFTTAHHATYQFSGLNPSASSHHHFPIADAHQNKDALCFPPTQ